MTSCARAEQSFFLRSTEYGVEWVVYVSTGTHTQWRRGEVQTHDHCVSRIVRVGNVPFVVILFWFLLGGLASQRVLILIFIIYIELICRHDREGRKQGHLIWWKFRSGPPENKLFCPQDQLSTYLIRTNRSITHYEAINDYCLHERLCIFRYSWSYHWRSLRFYRHGSRPLLSPRGLW